MSMTDFVTLRVGGQLFGVEASSVQDVFHPRGLTPAPHAREEIAGVLNLRGRIVTVVCARRRLGLPQRAPDEPEPMAIGLEIGGDSYGLVVDSVDEVLRLDTTEFHAPPGALPPAWADVVRGVQRLEGDLLVVLDAKRLLQPSASLAA